MREGVNSNDLFCDNCGSGRPEYVICVTTLRGLFFDFSYPRAYAPWLPSVTHCIGLNKKNIGRPEWGLWDEQ